MGQCVAVDKKGVFSLDSTPPASCTGYVMLSASEYSMLGQPYAITSGDVAYVFSWGFGVVLFFWSLGYAVGAAVRVIKLV